MKIEKTSFGYENMMLKTPFGFKGSALTGLWQTVACLESKNNFGIGLGVQSVLWSDAEVFVKYGENDGNALMSDITRFALEKALNMDIATPYELFDAIFPSAMEFGKHITNNPALRKTFVLNALVPVDFAAWVLYAREKGINDFGVMTKRLLNEKHDKLACVPIISYNTTVDEIIQMARDGVCLFKIKIGSDPDKDGNLEKMLNWDKHRLSEIHTILKEYNTPYTKSGKPLYYIDANGRYDEKGRLLKFVDYADKIGALDCIAILEEPFTEDNKTRVDDIPICIAADESIHSLSDVKERIELGYNAIALKPIAKTLSLTLGILKYALENNISCFCADLTVNPVMIEWNKNVAARIPLIKGMNIGFIEANGSQNYKDWDIMTTYHPLGNEKFAQSENGIFTLDERFYNTSGGIFETSKHYKDIPN